MFSISQLQKELAPNPFALLCSETGEGKTNIMAVSWWCYASNRPGTVIACLSNKGYSGECVRDSGEFALCFPSEEIKEAAFRCGTCSGRSVDKATEFGIELADAECISAKVVAKSKAVVECKLVGEFPVGDHTAYVGEVLAGSCDSTKKTVYAFDGYARLDTL